MNTIATSLTTFQPSHSSALQTALSPQDLRERVPAAFAPAAHERTSRSYTFISTERVLTALTSAGFLAVEARQAARARSPLHARHLIRLRRRFETIALRDAIPEILFLNSHDGTSAYLMWTLDQSPPTGISGKCRLFDPELPPFDDGDRLAGLHDPACRSSAEESVLEGRAAGNTGEAGLLAFQTYQAGLAVKSRVEARPAGWTGRLRS